MALISRVDRNNTKAGLLRHKAVFLKRQSNKPTRQTDRYGRKLPTAGAGKAGYSEHYTTRVGFRGMSKSANDADLKDDVVQSRDRARITVRISANAKQIYNDDRVRVKGATWRIVYSMRQEQQTERFIQFELESLVNPT